LPLRGISPRGGEKTRDEVDFFPPMGGIKRGFCCCKKNSINGEGWCPLTTEA